MYQLVPARQSRGQCRLWRSARVEGDTNGAQLGTKGFQEPKEVPGESLTVNEGVMESLEPKGSTFFYIIPPNEDMIYKWDIAHKVVMHKN